MDSHELRNLTSRNVDCGAGHEGANGRQWDKFDDPTEASESHECDDGTRNHCQRRSNNVPFNLGQDVAGSEDDIAGDLGHDGNGLKKLVKKTPS